jgi:hypothetical protein
MDISDNENTHVLCGYVRKALAADPKPAHREYNVNSFLANVLCLKIEFKVGFPCVHAERSRRFHSDRCKMQI